MKKSLLFATAIIALASCADSTFIGDQAEQQVGDGAISFNLNMPAQTRAEVGGATAASALNNQFIIWGEKNEAGDGTAASAANLVFENYKVAYTTNTAYTTTSNTKDWEYVGLTPYTQVTPYLSTTQTIKYWDYAATSYTFTAVSALPADITDGKVVITKNTSGSSSSVFNKGYDIEVKTGASLDNIFIADRNVIDQGTGTDRQATNAYGGNVTMRFRNFMSKIRFGIYETIPGYKVKITRVYYNSTSSTTNFGVDGKFLTVGDGSSSHTQLTVTYENPSNKAVVDVKSGTTPASTTYFETAPAAEDAGAGKPAITVPFLSAAYIGTSSSTATFDKTETVTAPASTKAGVYTTVIPFTSNDTNIKLKIDFQLISEDTGETINITERTAEVPAAYCQWKSNYAYSYLFKINDDDLYPITFDAVQITDENGEAEYITTVTEPSITTLGVNGSAYSVGQSEYAASTDVYATVVDGGSVVALAKSSNIWLYTVTGSDITEAAVAERLIEAPAMNAAQITTANTKTNPTDVTTASLTIQNTVPMEDNVSNDKTVGTSMVAKFTTAATTKYAIVYQKEAATYVWGTGSTCANQDALDALKAAAVDGKLYTNDQCTAEVASYTWSSAETVYYTANAAKYAADGDFTAAGNVFAGAGSVATPAASRANENTPYYKPIKVKSKGVYTVKLVTCP